MAEPSTHINYSFEDIQRYLQGKMTAAEMHAIEKAALQDPFLADAIEGYRDAASSVAQTHLDEINKALLNEKQDAKVISLKKNNQWLRIAAFVILLAGIGALGTYFFKTSNTQNQIAQVKNENKNSATADSVAALVPETSATNNEVQIPKENVNTPSAKSSKKEKNKPAINAAEKNEDEVKTYSRMAAPSLQKDEEAKALAALPTPKNDSINYLQGRVNELNVATKRFAGIVVDENNKPVPGAVIETPDKKEVVADLNGNFVLQKNDSLLTVTASTVGYENKTTLLTPETNNVIILKQNPEGLSNVVVTGYAKKKSATQTAMPVGGWQNFNNYVMNKLNKDSADNNNMSHEDVVELEFLIDDDGNPYNIHVVKSLDDERNSKAITILKSGPKWTHISKKKKAKVTIAF